jgi:TRAP-type C4-dicarboxylate transport system permease small subunit
MSRPAAGQRPPGFVLDAMARAALWIAGGALVVMALVEFWQVFARYELNDSPSWTEPVALLAMKWAMMLGAAAGVRAESHFGFFLLVQQVRPAVNRILVAFARLVMLATGAMLAGWGAILVRDGWAVPMAGISMPEGAGYLPVAAGGALIAVFAAGALAGRAPATDEED